MGRGAYHVFQAEADAARARGDTAGAIALSAKAGAALVVNPGPGRTAPAAPAGEAGTGSPDARTLVRAFAGKMAAARDALAMAGTPAGMDPGLLAELGTWRRYNEAVALLKSADPEDKARGSRIMCEPSVYELHQAETAGQPYRPVAKAAAPDLGEGAMIALAKRGDFAGLDEHFAAHPGSHERYRGLRVAGLLEPTPAERIELRKLTDGELKSKIKRLHASKDQKDKDALAKLLKDDERAAGLWGEMCLTGEIVPTMPS